MAYTPTISRMSGMSSGLDTDSLVKAMTSAQQYKIDKLLAKKTTTQWKSDAITSNNNLLRTFKDDFISMLGSKSMMKADAYNSMSVKGSSTAVTVTAAAGAKLGMHKIEVLQTATGARATGVGFAAEGQTLSSTNLTLKALVESSNRATGDVAMVRLTDANGDPIMTTDENGAEVPVMGFEFSINGKTFQFKESDKLSDVMSSINSSGAGVKLSYSQLSNAFTLESTTTGTGSQLNVEEGQSNFFSFLGLTGSGSGQNVFDPLAGQNAVAMVDGYRIERASNTFTLDGMTFNLNGVTDSAFEFSIERDVTSSVDMVKTFVDSLNEMLGKLDSLYRENKDRNYSPLSDEMKEAMSETEIADWETKAKAGLLHRDNNLGTLLERLQSAIGASVDGIGKLKDIGISFGEYKAGSISTIEIDEDKLKAALEADPDRVYNLMTKAADTTTGEQGGILSRIGAAIDKYTADTKTYDIQNLRDNVNDYVKRIAEQEDKLYTMQERLYLKYASFESALSSLQSQQSTIAGYFG